MDHRYHHRANYDKPSWFWALLAWVLAALLLLLVGCAAKPVIVGPGECAVIDTTDYVMTAGGDCDIQKVRK